MSKSHSPWPDGFNGFNGFKANSILKVEPTAQLSSVKKLLKGHKKTFGERAFP
jgi:hypothetical protein